MAVQSTRKSVLVVGGGLIGLCIANAVARSGQQVTLIDDDEALAAPSWNNAGHIAIEQITPLASWATVRSLPHNLFPAGPVSLPPREFATWLPFGLRLMAAARPARYRAGTAVLTALLAEAIPAWRRTLAAIGQSALLAERGHYVAWETARTAATGRAKWADAATGEAIVKTMSATAVHGLKAHTSNRIEGAVWFRGTAQITDAQALASALADGLRHAGGQIRRDRARLSRTRPGACSVLLADDTRIEADAIVIAGGVRSAELLRPLGHPVPIIAERGYHVQGMPRDWPTAIAPIVFEDRNLVVTRFDKVLRATSFVEFSRVDAPADHRKWRAIERHLNELGIAFDGATSTWLGARPTLPDYLPAIGRSSRASNVLYAFGHQHLGLTLAAVTGEIMADLVCDRAAQFAADALQIDRFRW